VNQTDSKCSHITVYAALLTRPAPYPRTQSGVLIPLLNIFYARIRSIPHYLISKERYNFNLYF